jgi:hypothetical protein
MTDIFKGFFFFLHTTKATFSSQTKFQNSLYTVLRFVKENETLFQKPVSGQAVVKHSQVCGLALLVTFDEGLLRIGAEVDRLQYRQNYGVRFLAGAGIFYVFRRVQAMSGAHSASFRNGIGGFFPGIMRPECQDNYSPSLNAEVKNTWNCTYTPPVRLHGVVFKHRIRFHGVVLKQSYNVTFQLYCSTI